MTANEKLTLLDELLNELPTIARIEKLRLCRTKGQIATNGNLSTNTIERLITTGDVRVSSLKRFIKALRSDSDAPPDPLLYEDEGYVIKMRRKVKSIKQKELADKLGWISQSTLSRVEQGFKPLTKKQKEEVLNTIDNW